MYLSPPPSGLAAVCSKQRFCFVNSMLIVAPVVRFCVCSMFCCALFCVLSSFAIILLVMIELVVLLFYFVSSSWCLVIVLFCGSPHGAVGWSAV